MCRMKREYTPIRRKPRPFRIEQLLMCHVMNRNHGYHMSLLFAFGKGRHSLLHQFTKLNFSTQTHTESGGRRNGRRFSGQEQEGNIWGGRQKVVSMAIRSRVKMSNFCCSLRRHAPPQKPLLMRLYSWRRRWEAESFGATVSRVVPENRPRWQPISTETADLYGYMQYWNIYIIDTKYLNRFYSILSQHVVTRADCCFLYCVPDPTCLFSQCIMTMSLFLLLLVSSRLTSTLLSVSSVVRWQACCFSGDVSHPRRRLLHGSQTMVWHLPEREASRRRSLPRYSAGVTDVFAEQSGSRSNSQSAPNIK